MLGKSKVVEAAEVAAKVVDVKADKEAAKLLG